MNYQKLEPSFENHICNQDCQSSCAYCSELICLLDEDSCRVVSTNTWPKESTLCTNCADLVDQGDL